MTIKEATMRMLCDIRIEYNLRKRLNKKDKDIAKEINITPASFSRLTTGVTTPKIMTWAKICALHKELAGETRNMEIIGGLTI